jgi:type IV pilus assembly protein PilY1
MQRSMTRNALVWLMILTLELPWEAVHAATANMDISSTPLDVRSAAKPNIIFALDDSGSMDNEVLLDTNDGAAWWLRPTSVLPGSPTPRQVVLQCQRQLGRRFRRHLVQVHVFVSRRQRHRRAHFHRCHVRPLRCPRDPGVRILAQLELQPDLLQPEHHVSAVGPGLLERRHAHVYQCERRGARSHPWLPTSGTPTTINLAAIVPASANANWTFKFFSGMTIPCATISGIIYRKNGGSWTSPCTTNQVLAGTATDDWDVQIPYYAATYYMLDTTCTVDGITCIITPDTKKIKRYEIKPGVTFPSGRTYAAELQNFANWFTYYRKRKLMLAGAMGQVLGQVRDVRGGIVKFNATSAVTMYDFNSTVDSTNARQLLGTVYTNPASGGTPTRDALNYVGQQFMRTDVKRTDSICLSAQCGVRLTDGFANASGPTVPSYTKTTWGNGAPFTTIYANSLADMALYYFTTNLRPALPTGLLSFDPTNTRPDADRNPNCT